MIMRKVLLLFQLRDRRILPAIILKGMRFYFSGKPTANIVLIGNLYYLGDQAYEIN